MGRVEGEVVRVDEEGRKKTLLQV